MEKNAPGPASPPTHPAPWRPFRPLHLLALALGTACLFTLGQVQGPLPALLSAAFGIHHPQQFALFAAGVLLVTFGLTGPTLRRPALPLRRCWPLLALMLLALVLRLWNLEGAVHLYVDETHFADAVTRLWDKPDVQMLTYISPIAAFTWVFPYLQHFVMLLAGPSLAGLRLLSVLLGVLTLPAVYGLGRGLFGHKTGLLAAGLLAVFPPHIHFSRLALNNIADPLIAAALLAALVAALRGGGRAHYALAGVLLGLSQYFYEGGRLLVPPLLLLWLLALWAGGWRGLPRPSRRGLLLMFTGAALVAMPYYMTLSLYGATITPRLGLAGMETTFWTDLLAGPDGLAQLAVYFRERLNPALLHFIHAPDGSAFYYGGETALLLPALLPFFLLGLAAALWRWRGGGSLLLIWPLLTALGNSLIEDNNWSARFVVAFPALVLLTALGMHTLWRLLQTAAPQAAPRLRPAAALLLVALATGQVLYYFGPHLALYNQQIRPFLDHQDVGFRSLDMPPGTEVYLLSNELTFKPHITTMQRLADVQMDLFIVNPGLFVLVGLEHLRPGRPYAFFVLPDDGETIRSLRARFGPDLHGPYFSPFNLPLDKQYALYSVPAAPGAPPPGRP